VAAALQTRLAMTHIYVYDLSARHCLHHAIHVASSHSPLFQTYLRLQDVPNVASFSLGDPVYNLWPGGYPRSGYWHRRCGHATSPGRWLQSTVLNMELRREGCLRQIAAHEVGTGIKYSWVLVTRPDIQFSRAFPKMEDWAKLPKGVVLRPLPHGWFADARRGMDIWAVMTRDVANVYLSCSGYWYRCHTVEEV